MKDKLSRRTVLQLSIAAGVGAGTAAHAARTGGEAFAPQPAGRQSIPNDSSDAVLLRYGGELGGTKQ